jgi:K+-transporting ATPase ATPase A chain
MASPIRTLFAVITTAASCGAVNGMHDSFTPLGGMVPMVMMQLGEVVFGGVGSGLYGMLIFAILAVFIAGLMIGRTRRNTWARRSRRYEMKLTSMAILATPHPGALRNGDRRHGGRWPGRASSIRGAHGFSEVLYAFSSAGEQQRQRLCGSCRPTRRSTTGLLGHRHLVRPLCA